MSDRLSRAQGALVGQAVGDALGTTVEFSSPAAVRQRFPAGVRDVAGGGPFGVRRGQITDDTELALALARSLAAEGRWVPLRVAEAYVDWAESRPFDIGGTTARALAWDPPRDAHLAERMMARANELSEANGALMRISPLGILGASLPERELVEAAVADARLTHPNVVCLQANVVFTWAIARAIRTGARGRGLYDATVAFARDAAPQVVDTLEHAETLPDDLSPQMGWVRHALRAAFHFLAHDTPFADALPELTLRGGDTDTNCAIAGALLGAAQGLDAIPLAWREAVLACRSDRPPTYQTNDLLELAANLLR